MVRVIFIAIGGALIVAGALVGGLTAAHSRTNPAQVTRAWRDWALGLVLAGALAIALALINWGIYHPSTIQLPFVNER
jgi:hypothetical protein